jgi:hypothetical protein
MFGNVPVPGPGYSKGKSQGNAISPQDSSDPEHDDSVTQQKDNNNNNKRTRTQTQRGTQASAKPRAQNTQDLRNARRQTPTYDTEASNFNSTSAQKDSYDAPTKTEVPIDRVIAELKKAGTKISTVHDAPPEMTEAEIRPPALNLDPIKLGTSGLPSLDDLTLCGWLSSNDVLPCWKQFALELSQDEQLQLELEALFAADASPPRKTIQFLAQNAPRYVKVIHHGLALDHPQRNAALFWIKHVRRIQRCTTAHFMHFLLRNRYPRLDDIFYMLSAGAIVTIYLDLQVKESATFSHKMVGSRLAEPMVLQARQAWDKLLVFSGNKSGADTKNSVALVHAAAVAFADQGRHGAAYPPLGAAMDRKLQDEAMSQCQKLQSSFATAMRKSPELMTIIPPETGRIKPQELESRDGLVGFPPRQRPGPLECDKACKKQFNLHTLECGAKICQAKKDSIEDNGTDPSFTFQVPRVDEDANQKPPGVKCRKWVDDLSAEEQLNCSTHAAACT